MGLFCSIPIHWEGDVQSQGHYYFCLELLKTRISEVLGDCVSLRSRFFDLA